MTVDVGILRAVRQFGREGFFRGDLIIAVARPRHIYRDKRRRGRPRSRGKRPAATRSASTSAEL